MTDDTPKKLRAEDNPWFLLATLYGQPSPGKTELKSRNRAAWNRYMANALSREGRERLVNEGRCSKEEMAPCTAQELEAAFVKRHKQAISAASTSIPDFEAGSIDLSNIKVDGSFEAEGFCFPNQVSFSGTIFSDEAIFERATFCGLADFGKANFLGSANFGSVTFSGTAIFTGSFSDEARFEDSIFYGYCAFLGTTFHNTASFERGKFFSPANMRDATFYDLVVFKDATFSSLADFTNANFFADSMFQCTKFEEVLFEGAVFSSVDAVARESSIGQARRHNFESAHFSGRTNFLGAKFTVPANFTNVTFSNEARFCRAVFKSESLFVNAKMEAPASFERTRFQGPPPSFSGAQLHEGTIWRKVKMPVPKRASEAGAYVDAYERLKLEMDRLKKHEDELDFFALELQSRRVLAGRVAGIPIALYGLLCDYGRSYFRPLIGLFFTIGVGAILFLPHFSLRKYPRAIGLSFANTFAVLGFRKDFLSLNTIEALSRILIVASAVQTVAGIVLLFCFGLAVRNRFRMK
jgi:uncharacterized protein YjbI with pentapeptide repeats